MGVGHSIASAFFSSLRTKGQCPGGKGFGTSAMAVQASAPDFRNTVGSLFRESIGGRT